MKLIVGLGNPGEKYEHTRHNFGFMVVEQFLKDFETLENTVWSVSEKVKSDIALIDWNRRSAGRRSSEEGSGQAVLERVVLAKPKTYMNNSGMAISLLASFYKIAPADIWIVYDELDLPLGSMKIRFGGAAAGHHGVESIMENLGTDKFWRFRMGIGTTRQHSDNDDERQHAISKKNIRDAEDIVLGNFNHTEQGKVRELIKHGSDALQMALEKGIESAMNRYNTK